MVLIVYETIFTYVVKEISIISQFNIVTVFGNLEGAFLPIIHVFNNNTIQVQFLQRLTTGGHVQNLGISA